MEIGKSFNKALKQVDSRIRRSGNGSGSGGGSYARSNVIFHKCGKKVHFQKDFRSKGNGSVGKPSKNSTNDLP